MPSHGVVPALSSLRGAVGYFERGTRGGRQAQQQQGQDTPADEERQSLLLATLPTNDSQHTTQQQKKQPAADNSNNSLPTANGRHVAIFELAEPAESSWGSTNQQQQQPEQEQPEQQQEPGQAEVSSRQCTFDSLDYELIDNTVYRTDAAGRTHLDHILEGATKWTICFALGIITAAAAFAVNFGVENIAGFKFWATLTLLERRQAFASYLVYVLINCSLVVGSVALTVLVAPAAAGSGIAEVKAYLNGIDVPSIFFFKTLVVKLSGSVGAVAGGLAVGKEGPFVHAGACLGALLSQGGSSTRHLPWFKRFWNDRDRADFVACGTAAGVAAAFRSPVGGVLFALEEMTSWFRNQLLWYAFFTTAVVSVAVRAFMRVCQSSQGGRGTCGFFGSGGYLLYEITEGQENFDIVELLPVLLLGVIGGLLGSCFTYLNEALAVWRKKVLFPHGARGRIWEGLVAALLTSTVSFMVPMLVACQPCPSGVAEVCPRVDNTHGGNFVDFACPAGYQYHDLATIFFNTQDDAIRNLFSAQTKNEYSVSSLLTFSSAFFLLAVLSYGVALPTGLFVPSILCGAAYGRLVGVFVADLRPLTGGSTSIDEGTYALLGAASFLGGCMRMTVATCVMLLELTNNLALLPLMMLVTLVAKAVGDGTGIKPIYESLMELKGLPFLEPHPDSLAHHITAAEAAGNPAVTFLRVERVATIVEVLQRTKHNGFAVIERSMDGEQHIMGVVLRSQLAVLLRSRRCFQPTSFVSELAGRVVFSYQGSDFLRPISEAADDLRGLRLSEQELAMFLDLGPYINPSYYAVQEDTSLSKVHTMFRQLGLRHLAVIPRASSVVGIITRHDLMPEALEETFMGQQVPLGSGAVGLASALRGTVRQALDAYQRRARHSRHSSAGSGALRSLRSALGATPAATTVSPWQQLQQQQQPQQQLQTRLSWAPLQLSPLASAAIGVTSSGGTPSRTSSSLAAAAATAAASPSRTPSGAAAAGSPAAAGSWAGSWAASAAGAPAGSTPAAAAAISGGSNSSSQGALRQSAGVAETVRFGSSSSSGGGGSSSSSSSSKGRLLVMQTRKGGSSSPPAAAAGADSRPQKGAAAAPAVATAIAGGAAQPTRVPAAGLQGSDMAAGVAAQPAPTALPPAAAAAAGAAGTAAAARMSGGVDLSRTTTGSSWSDFDS